MKLWWVRDSEKAESLGKRSFLTSKLRNAAHGYDNVLKEVETTLKDLGTDYLDLYLIHWTVVKGHKTDWKEDNLDTWRAFEKLYEEGKLKAIGVSNFSREHLENLLENDISGSPVKSLIVRILTYTLMGVI